MRRSAVHRAAAVALGGALGALARWGLDVAMAIEGWPAATLVANLVGAFVLGLLTRRLGESPPAVGVRVGLLGAFTTWSALVVQVVDLGERPAVAIGYLLVSLGGGLALAALGLRLGASRPGDGAAGPGPSRW